MLTVVAFAFVYPAGLLAFIFAESPVQWLWLGYQLYTMVAMHLYRFCGGERIGTTEARIARALSEKDVVRLAYGSGNVVVASLERKEVDRVRDGYRQVDALVGVILSRRGLDEGQRHAPEQGDTHTE
jgi:hypothetical protein